MEESKHHTTKAQDRVSFGKKTSYGVGMINFSLLLNAYAQIVNPIFVTALGIGPGVISFIGGLMRIWDAFTDPFMGKVSDNTRGRFGRRRPWILVGTILVAGAFISIWWFPLGQSEGFYKAWLFVTTLVFYTAFTVFAVPYIALGMEMSTDYHERTRIVAFRDFLQPLGLLSAMGALYLASKTLFDSPIEGMRVISILIGFVVLVLGSLAAIFPREHPSLKQSKSQPKISLVASVRKTFAVTPFLLLAGSTAVLNMGASMVGPMGYFLTYYYLFQDDMEATTWLLLVATFASVVLQILMVPVITWISTKLGKRKTLLWFIIISIAGSASKWWLITPEAPYLSLIPGMLMGLGFIASSTMINSMVADTVDFDELISGSRREGMFSAVYGWTWKLGIALAVIVSGFLVEWTGFDADAVVQGSQTIVTLRLLDLGIPIIGFLAGFVMILKYPINEAKAYEVRAQLEAKRCSER